MLKHVIRGMLPHKTSRGKIAFNALKVRQNRTAPILKHPTYKGLMTKRWSIRTDREIRLITELQQLGICCNFNPKKFFPINFTAILKLQPKFFNLFKLQ